MTAGGDGCFLTHGTAPGHQAEHVHRVASCGPCITEGGDPRTKQFKQVSLGFGAPVAKPNDPQKQTRDEWWPRLHHRPLSLMTRHIFSRTLCKSFMVRNPSVVTSYIRRALPPRAAIASLIEERT